MANELKHKTVGTELTQSEFEGTDLHQCDSQAIGDLLYASSTIQLSRLAKGTDGDFLASGTPPTWVTHAADLDAHTFNIVSVAADYLATEKSIILVDASGGNITISLPAAIGSIGRLYCIKKIDSSSNLVIVDGNNVETIDGNLTVSITTQFASLAIVCNGSSWSII